MAKIDRSCSGHPQCGGAGQLLEWWLAYIDLWNGPTLLFDGHWTSSPAFELFMDASGGAGYSAFFQGHWFRGDWTIEHQGYSIAWKELAPIVLACKV